MPAQASAAVPAPQAASPGLSEPTAPSPVKRPRRRGGFRPPSPGRSSGCGPAPLRAPKPLRAPGAARPRGSAARRAGAGASRLLGAPAASRARPPPRPRPSQTWSGAVCSLALPPGGKVGGGTALGSPGIASSAPQRPLAAAGRTGGGCAGGGALPSSLRVNRSEIWKKNPSFAVTATPRPRPAQGKWSLGL